MSSRSHRENTKLLDERIIDGSIDQYFSFSKDDIKELAIARNEDNFEDMATLMIDNLSSNSESFATVIIKAYDSQIQAIADRLIDNYVTRIETQIMSAFNTSDLSDIRDLIKEVDSFEPSPGFKKRKDKILKQLQGADVALSTPAEIRKIAFDLVKDKGKDPEDIKKSKIVEKWGSQRKLALVIWGKKGIITAKFLDKKIPKSKKTKLKFIPTKKENIGKTSKQILSKKGQGFSIKERVFVKARKNKSDDEVFDDYVRIIGNTRPKSEIMNLIKLRHDPNITDLRQK